MSKPIQTPSSWENKYQAQDQLMAMEIIDHLNANPELTLAELARVAKLDRSTAHQVINGKYPSPPKEHILKLKDAITAIRLKASNQTQFVETSVWQLVKHVCDRARSFAHEDDIGVLFGVVGVGKTTALKEYVKRHPMGIYLRSFTNMNQSTLLNRLVEATNTIVKSQSSYSRGTNADKMDAIINNLADTQHFIIMDEANQASPSSIQILRDISDDAGVALILAGREYLEPMLQDEQGRFGEISSRIGFWPQCIRNISNSDCDLLVNSCFGDDVNNDCLEMFWQCSGGSARVLSKLMASVQRFMRNKNTPLSSKLISEAWRNTMRPGGLKSI